MTNEDKQGYVRPGTPIPSALTRPDHPYCYLSYPYHRTSQTLPLPHRFSKLTPTEQAAPQGPPPSYPTAAHNSDVSSITSPSPASNAAALTPYSNTSQPRGQYDHPQHPQPVAQQQSWPGYSGPQQGYYSQQQPSYGQQQPYYGPPGPQGQQGMYYQQQGMYGPGYGQQGYYNQGYGPGYGPGYHSGQRGPGGAAEGAAAGLCGALACCCCLDLLLF